MTDGRLTSAMMVGAFLRFVDQDGGFAVVASKGDPTSGAILVQLLEKGRFIGLFERLLDPSGQYLWSRSVPQDIEKKEEISEYYSRRKARDPDLWLIELDVPNAERFIVQRLNMS
jgi:hypothetical protein